MVEMSSTTVLLFKNDEGNCLQLQAHSSECENPRYHRWVRGNGLQVDEDVVGTRRPEPLSLSRWGVESGGLTTFFRGRPGRDLLCSQSSGFPRSLGTTE